MQTRTTAEQRRRPASAAGAEPGRRGQRPVPSALCAAGSDFDPDGAAALTHDLRNLITSLSLYCELADEAEDRREVRRLSRQMRSLLNRSRACMERAAGREGAGRPRGVCDLAEEIEACLPLLEMTAGIQVSLSIDVRRARSTVPVAAEDLTRILLNLVRNAADAMPAGGHIHLAAEGGGEGGEAILRLEDSGCGLTAEAAERAFEPGFSTKVLLHPGAPAAGARGGPRGQGLAIVRSLVERAGGRVSLSPGAGGGAVAEVRLPVVAAGGGLSRAGLVTGLIANSFAYKPTFVIRRDA